MAAGTKRGQSGDEVGTLLYDESEFNHSFIPFAPCHAPTPGRPVPCRVAAHSTNFERERAFPWKASQRKNRLVDNFSIAPDLMDA